MATVPLKGAQTGPRKHMHRLLQARITKPFATAPSQSSTHVSMLTSSTSPMSGTASTPFITPAATPTVTLTSSTAPSAPSSTPSTTTAPSSTPSTTTTPLVAPSSTPTPSAPIVNEQQQQDTRVDGRLHIHVDGKELEPSGKCANIIRKAFKDRVDPNGHKWVTLSEEIKEFYWEEFQKKCYWDVEDGPYVKTAWEHVAKDKYRMYIFNMSSRTRNKTGQKPSHIEENVWVAWNVVWNSEEFKKKSEQNKKNRHRGVEGGIAPPTHNGGSASHKQIATDMEECMGRPPTCYELFMFTHTEDHDGKTLTNERAKQVQEFYDSQYENSEAIQEEVDDIEMFYKAVGGHDRKKRVYRLGSYGRSMFLGKSSDEKCTTPNPNPQHLKSKIQKLEATVEQQQMDLSDMRNTVNDLRSMMEK